MSEAAADMIAVRGLDDIISVSEVATVVWEQAGSISDQELMAQTLATIRVLIDRGWAEFGDMVVDEWTSRNQELALTNPDEAMERLFARSRELAAGTREGHRSPIRKWPLTTAETLARIADEWTALGTRTPDPPDIGWLLTTAAGDERGRMILGLQDRLIDLALKQGRGSIVHVSDFVSLLETEAPDFTAEEVRECVVFALFGLLTRDLAEIGSMRRILGWMRFVRWRSLSVDEVLDRVRRTCREFPGGPPEGEACAIRVLVGET